MIFDVSSALYAPMFRWKLGEVKSLAGLSGEFADRVLPIFAIPPGADFDWEELKTFTATEHIRHFGKRLHDCWGSRPAFVDVHALEEERLIDELGIHPLTALTERARLAGANAFPLVMLGSSQATIAAASTFLSRHEQAMWCLRIKLAELDAPGLRLRIQSMFGQINRDASSCVLVLDAGPIRILDDGFIDLLIDRLNELPFLESWSALFFSSAGFPEKRKLAVGEVGTFRRLDRELFEMLLSRGGELIRQPAYSDYGVEYPAKFVKGGGAAVAHLRFTSPTHFLISQGPSTKGNGFLPICDVAAILAKREEFVHATRSSGKQFIEQLAVRAKTGNPSTWRWAANDHHISVVMMQIYADKGISVSSVESVSHDQLTLV